MRRIYAAVVRERTASKTKEETIENNSKGKITKLQNRDGKYNV